MANQKYIELVDRLHMRTQEGRLKWFETPQKGVFAALLRGYSLQIETERSDDPDPETLDYRFTILNGDGDVVESLSDIVIGNGLAPTELRMFYQKCRELYDMARRKALGVDDALDSILDELS
jgi:hypothetical protein